LTDEEDVSRLPTNDDTTFSEAQKCPSEEWGWAVGDGRPAGTEREREREIERERREAR